MSQKSIPSIYKVDHHGLTSKNKHDTHKVYTRLLAVNTGPMAIQALGLEESRAGALAAVF